jgi:hypothetical protein
MIAENPQSIKKKKRKIKPSKIRDERNNKPIHDF